MFDFFNNPKVLNVYEGKSKLFFLQEIKYNSRTNSILFYHFCSLPPSSKLLNYSVLITLVISILFFSCLTKARRKVWRQSRKYPEFPIPKINHSIAKQKHGCERNTKLGEGGGQKNVGEELPTSRMKNGAGSGHRKHSVALAEVKPPAECPDLWRFWG